MDKLKYIWCSVSESKLESESEVKFLFINLFSIFSLPITPLEMHEDNALSIPLIEWVSITEYNYEVLLIISFSWK